MPHRYICDVLDEMRTADKTKNYSYMCGLIEETQTLANRMESKLYEHKEHDKLHEQVKELKKIKSKLTKSIKEEGGEIPHEIESLW